MVEVDSIKQAYDQVCPFRVIIAGTRTFDDYELLKAKCNELLANKERIEVVSGTNGYRHEDGTIKSGADLMGEQWAKENGHPVKQFPPDWDSYGKIAGPRRNEQMAEYADALIAFRGPGKSNGTDGMIKLAKAYKIPVRIIKY